MLQSLAGYYDRMAARGEAEAPGWSREKFGWCVVLSEAGEPVAIDDLHNNEGRKPAVTLREVPAAAKRTVAVVPNLFWDKTAYTLGRTSGTGRRTAQEHAAFRDANFAAIAGATDPGLVAFARFLETWTPERFDADPFAPAMLDANILFRLDGDYCFLHERDAARAIVEARAGGDERAALCLVTGVTAPVARLHPTIKGVEGAQSSGAALVSFNLDAFSSWGRAQGDNAPTSQGASFRYGAALNRLLDRGSRNRVRVGDTTVVFWADASAGEAAAAKSETLIWEALEPPPGDTQEAARLAVTLDALAKGRPLADSRPGVDPSTRIHVLGLAPNAARLSVRFWVTDRLDDLVGRLAAHHHDLAIVPAPRRWGVAPSINWLLVKTVALQEKFDNIAPQLGGELARAVLTGDRYPRAWLAATIMRLRAGDDPGTGWHAAAIKASIARTPSEETPPVSLEPDNPNPAYQLGRLFAAYENAQRAALGRNVNATIRDRYFGAASATPASVFPLLIRGAQNHLSKVRKEKPGLAVTLEREIEGIVGHLPGTFPRSLRLEEQGRFAIGYYHQRGARFAGVAHDTDEGDDDNGE